MRWAICPALLGFGSVQVGEPAMAQSRDAQKAGGRSTICRSVTQRLSTKALGSNPVVMPEPRKPSEPSRAGAATPDRLEHRQRAWDG